MTADYMGSAFARPQGDFALDTDDCSNTASTTPITLNLDGNIYLDFFADFGPADVINLVSARGEADPTGHHYSIVLTNVEFARDTPYLTVDGSTLAGDSDGAGPLQEETASISTANVTNYNAHITTGGGSDFVASGQGSDTISTGAGNDQIEMGGGNDVVDGGSGDDYIENLIGDFNGNDIVRGGDGNDELSLYQSVTDADFAHVSSLEMLFFTGNSDIELGASALASGTNALYLDNSVHHITIGASFTRALTVNLAGDQSGHTSLDASATTATITVHSEYTLATTAPVLVGGKGANDSLYLSAGFAYDGAPAYGGDLRHVTGFEHIYVRSTGGGLGASVILATKATDIDAAFQTVDARSLGLDEPFTLHAGTATAAIHAYGGAGADVLALGVGDDTIQGGAGADMLSGGAGKDIFAYTAVGDSAGDAVDTITDFRSGTDRINVTGLAAGTPSLDGEVINFLGNAATADVAAQDVQQTGYNNRLDAVFERDTHTLWFDTNDDGQFDASDLHIVLKTVSALTAADIFAGHVIA